MRNSAVLCSTVLLLSFLSCDQENRVAATWQKVIDLSTGNGVIQNREGDFIVFSAREIAKLDKNGAVIWSIDPLDQLTDFSGLSISEIVQLETGEYVVTGFGLIDASRVQYLFNFNKNGVVQSQSNIYANDYYRGLDMSVDENGFTFAIPVGQGNRDDSLVVLQTDVAGMVFNKKSYVINRDDYAITGLTKILENQEGFLLELVLKSINGNEETNRKLIKLDADMNQEWSVDYGGPLYNEVKDILELDSGGYLLSGTYQGKGWALKISTSGSLVWDKKYGSDEPGKQLFFEAEETEMGRIVMTGSNNVGGAGYDDLWLLSVNEEGNTIWEIKHGDSYFNFGRSVVYTKEKNYVVTGGTQASFEDPIKMWVLRLNEDGKF